MKYALTGVIALLFGTAGFRVAELLKWRSWQERLLILTAASVAAARLCAGVWM